MRRVAILASAFVLSACGSPLPTPASVRALFEKDPLLIPRPPADAALIARGRALYHEAASCAPCHDDGLRAPILLDAARVYLFGSHGEHTGLEDAIAACAAQRAEPQHPEQVSALAAYLETLRTRSRWDQFLDGKTHALRADERRGLERFVTLGCAACHGNRLLGGRSAHELKDVDGTTTRRRAAPLAHAARSAPYFHDASAKTLEEAIRSMGTRALGKTLTKRDVTAIARFLRAVDDTRGEH